MLSTNLSESLPRKKGDSHRFIASRTAECPRKGERAARQASQSQWRLEESCPSVCLSSLQFTYSCDGNDYNCNANKTQLQLHTYYDMVLKKVILKN
eukprot:3253790-Amphidinium_carterae.1